VRVYDARRWQPLGQWTAATKYDVTALSLGWEDDLLCFAGSVGGEFVVGPWSGLQVRPCFDRKLGTVPD
jgi:hypothetical protein